jgi:hypothetical protein
MERVAQSTRKYTMKKTSKGFFVGSLAIGFGLGQFFIISGVIKARGGDASQALRLIEIGLIPILYAAVVNMGMWYKIWTTIQDGSARTTPGKAIGLLFIPLFNYYWQFQVWWGFSKDYNAYVARHNVLNDKLPEGLFLTNCILSLASMIPFFGIILGAINYFITLVLVSKVCDAINGLTPSEII